MENLQIWQNSTKLERKVYRIIKPYFLDILSYEEDFNKAVKTLEYNMQGGLTSGYVSEFIYYTDINKFYSQYKTAIIEHLKDLLNICGYSSFKELFGNKWDNDDYFIKEDNNRMLVVYCILEEIIFRIIEHNNNN